MNKKPVIMISSTVKDLPAYRSMVLDACHRSDTDPKMMEHLSAMNADAIEASLAMVDESDIYIGIFAHKYGYVPDDHEISITEMEYNRAVERGLPRLIFIMSDEVAVLPKDIDKGSAAEKLETLKGKLKKNKVVAFYKNPEDLRGLVIHSLSKEREKLEKDTNKEKNPGSVWAESLHSAFDIPFKPAAFVAHPYTLLQVKGLIGRKRELEVLTDWVTKPKYDHLSIFNIVAIGGMGKSALTWSWFNDVAPQEKDWAGRVWWSFYETDATFDSFITKTLIYVSGRPEEEIKKLSQSDKQASLFQKLDSQPYLIVLDGLERILIAYARQDAAFLDDDTALDKQTANWVAGASGLPASSAKSLVGKHRLRKTVDARIGHFLRQLIQLQQSKILISTRLFPADLQAAGGSPLPKCSALFLNGLSNPDALELWRAYGAKGSREQMLPIFSSFDKHPLLLQLLASEVAEFRSAPGDFDAWRKANQDFNVFGLPLVQVQSHVLSYALKGLSMAERKTLQVIAGFRMPASMETLKALLIKTEEGEEDKGQVFTSETALDQALTILEDKGLLGWDRRSNRYDLHPIVRGVVWSNLDANKQYEIHGSLRRHFEAMPIIEDITQIESVEYLRPAIELYNSLIAMELYDEAFQVFVDRLSIATFYRLSANNLRVELLERLFVDGIDQLPALSLKNKQGWVISALAQGYHFSGQSGKAIPLIERDEEICRTEGDQNNQAIVLANLSDFLQLTGQLFRAEATANKSLILARKIKKYYPEILSLESSGRVLVQRGAYDQGKKAFEFTTKLAIDEIHKQREGLGKALLSKVSILIGEYQLAKKLANQAWELATVHQYERDFIRAAYYQGFAALYLNDLNTAHERLHHALKRVRAVQLIEEELHILIALAEFYRRQSEAEKAREHLEEIWDRAEQGPYPLFHADALNVLAQIEIDAGNNEKAIAAATKAYELAWCDGPPYAYHYGLQNAKRLLKELDAKEPELPPFDASKFEPMPEVVIDPGEEEE